MSVFDQDKIDKGIIPIELDTMKEHEFEMIWGTNIQTPTYIKTFKVSSMRKCWWIDCVVEGSWTGFHMRFRTLTHWVPRRFKNSVKVRSVEDVLDIVNQFTKWCLAHQKYIIK